MPVGAIAVTKALISAWPDARTRLTELYDRGVASSDRGVASSDGVSGLIPSAFQTTCN